MNGIDRLCCNHWLKTEFLEDFVLLRQELDMYEVLLIAFWTHFARYEESA